jgi:CHAT domain
VAESAYLNFDLIISFRADNRYHLQVRSPGGNPQMEFEVPISADEVVTLREVVQGPARDAIRRRHERRLGEPDPGDLVRLLGERLFDGVITSEVFASYMASIQEGHRQAKGLRVRLWLDGAPKLAELPWEYLYSRSIGGYLTLSKKTPVVRFLSLPYPPLQLLSPFPLNILVMISDPDGYQPLAVEHEWETICRAVKQLEDEKLVSIERVPSGTIEDLQECLGRQKKYHVFHFIGHGDFHPETGEASLLLEQRENRKGRLVGKDELKVALDQDSIRLVILNSCEGARVDGLDPFGGLAQSLVQKGIPAAVAMQFKITDTAAVTFAGKFYRTMAQNHPVDEALAEARKAIYFAKNPTEWGTPVLYLNAEDGQIIQFDRSIEEQLRQRQIETLTSDAHTAIDNKEYALAIQKLQEIQRLRPETI